MKLHQLHGKVAQGLLTLAILAAVPPVRAAINPAVPASAPGIAIINPPEQFQMYINDTIPVVAVATIPDLQSNPRPELPTGAVIRWSATAGFFTDPASSHSNFIALDYSDPPIERLTLYAFLYLHDVQVSSAHVSTGSSAANGMPASSSLVLLAAPADGLPQVPATIPADPAAIRTAEQASYNSSWRSNVGEPPASHGDEFIHELVEARKAKDRDSNVEHLKNALKLRPEDPLNIVIEFEIAIALSQHADPTRNQMPDPEAAIPYFQHIVEHYDHKAYYRVYPSGEGSESPAMKVPFAAELLASMTVDPAKADEYLTVAMDDSYWTFQKRTQDWLSTPRPSTQPSRYSPFNNYPASLLAAWEKQQADAKEGKAVGPYEDVLAEAIMRQYVDRHKDNLRPALQSVVEKYPKSPLATAALAQLASLPAAPAPQPSEAPAALPAPNPPEAIATSQPVLMLDPPVSIFSFALPAAIGGITIALVILFVATRKKRPS